MIKGLKYIPKGWLNKSSPIKFMSPPSSAFPSINNNERKFSMLSNKLFNSSVQDYPKLSREEAVQFLDSVKKSNIDPEKDDIEKHLKDFPEKTLPSKMFGSLFAGSVANQFLFEQLLALIQHQKEDVIDLEQAERDCVKSFVRYSQFNNIIIKGIQREWFDFKDLEQLYSEPFLLGVEIDGKDLVYLDQVTFFSTLYEGLLRKYTNQTQFTTRETLMCLICLITLKVQIPDDSNYVLGLMQRFVNMYPIVKQLYMTPSEGDIKKSWADVLGKVYSEDEFDWYQDLETDLPIHLGGMHNIFKEYLNRSSNTLKVLEEESKRAPNNPYIPCFKFVMNNEDMSCTDECLTILQNSSTIPRVADLKRIEWFHLFNSKKPLNRVKDFKFFPQLLIKLRHQCSLPDTDLSNSAFLVDQLEYYSRVPTYIDLILCKFILAIKAERLEEALQIYQLFSHYEHLLSQDLLLYVVMKAATSLVDLGYQNDAIELAEKFNARYGDDNPEWEWLLTTVKDHILHK